MILWNGLKQMAEIENFEKLHKIITVQSILGTLKNRQGLGFFARTSSF